MKRKRNLIFFIVVVVCFLAILFIVYKNKNTMQETTEEEQTAESMDRDYMLTFLETAKIIDLLTNMQYQLSIGNITSAEYNNFMQSYEKYTNDFVYAYINNSIPLDTVKQYNKFIKKILGSDSSIYILNETNLKDVEGWCDGITFYQSIYIVSSLQTAGLISKEDMVEFEEKLENLDVSHEGVWDFIYYMRSLIYGDDTPIYVGGNIINSRLTFLYFLFLCIIREFR